MQLLLTSAFTYCLWRPSALRNLLIVPALMAVVALMGIIASDSSNNVIQGNLIGVDATGTTGLGNSSEGIRFFSTGSGNLIGGTVAGARNIVSANVNDGISITFGPSSNTVQGNFVGTDVTGTKALGNHDGVQISGNGNNLIGRTIAAARNIVSANLQHGVIVLGYHRP